MSALALSQIYLKNVLKISSEKTFGMETEIEVVEILFEIESILFFNTVSKKWL
jgi:hypothetical protein